MTDFDTLARAIRDHIGFDSSDLCINGGGRYIRYQLRAAGDTGHRTDGVGEVRSIGASGRVDGRSAYREYLLPTPIAVAAGRGVTDEVPDFRELVAALRRVGLSTNDSDYPSEVSILALVHEDR